MNLLMIILKQNNKITFQFSSTQTKDPLNRVSKLKYISIVFFFFFFFFWTLVSVSSQAYNSFNTMQLDFISQPFLKVHPPICRITAYATMPRQSFSTNFVPSFDPIELCLKNGLHSGGSNSQPFSYESSALTTRPRLLAKLGLLV